MSARLAGILLLVLAALPTPEIARANPQSSGDDVQRSAQSGPRAARARRARIRRARARRLRERRQRIRRQARHRRMVRRWHRRAPREEVRRWRAGSPPPLVLRPVGRADRFELTPDGDDGGFGDDDLALAREALRHRDGDARDIHPRLIELVYRAVRHFEVPYVHVVSGYRPDSATSRHTQGRAIDMVLPGVSDRRLARYLHRLGFVGVGIYVRSGFVHLDVRDRSYFWIDRSRPGQRQRTRPILKRAAQRTDAEARRRGEEPVPDLVPGEADEQPPEAPPD